MRVDLDRIASDRRALSSQYAGPAGLNRRVALYDFLVPDRPRPSGWAFEDWVLDHHRWDRPQRVLDLGCGPGRYLSALAGRGPGWWRPTSRPGCWRPCHRPLPGTRAGWWR